MLAPPDCVAHSPQIQPEDIAAAMLYLVKASPRAYPSVVDIDHLHDTFTAADGSKQGGSKL